MADKHSSEGQQSEVKVSSSFMWGVVASIVLPVILIILIATIVYTSYIRTASPSKVDPELIKARIKPIGEVVVRDPNAPVVLKSGEEVFKGLCISCHGSGLMGAPKFADKEAWSKVLSQGQEIIFEHALRGIRKMPAKGGNPDFEDIEIKRAVVYMANMSGGSLKLTDEKQLVAAAVSIAETVPVPTTPSPVAVAAKPVTDGKATFEASCVACHGAGLMGAPKAGDKAAWAARISAGKPVLYEHALKGIRLMPAKGGNPALSDDEIKAAVDHLVSLVK